MKVAALLCGSTLLLAAAQGARAQEFEGAITLRFTTTGGDGAPVSNDLLYFTRKGNVRIELGAGGGGMAMIVLPSDKKVYMLMTAQSMYAEVDMPDVAERASAATPKVTRTGRRETIAGFTCEHVEIVTAKETTDICVAKGLGTYTAFSGIVGRMNAEPWQRAVLAEGGFPMKVSQGGQTALEVTKVERKSLSEGLFAVPESFNRTEMPRRRP